jgi:C4-type Zn-finger protein
MIDKARDRAAGMPAFLEQKIAAEPATTTKATLTTLKGDIARLSEDLTRLRADEPLPTDEAASKINALDNNIFKAYSL